MLRFILASKGCLAPGVCKSRKLILVALPQVLSHYGTTLPKGKALGERSEQSSISRSPYAERMRGGKFCRVYTGGLVYILGDYEYPTTFAFLRMRIAYRQRLAPTNVRLHSFILSKSILESVGENAMAFKRGKQKHFYSCFPCPIKSTLS